MHLNECRLAKKVRFETYNVDRLPDTAAPRPASISSTAKVPRWDFGPHPDSFSYQLPLPQWTSLVPLLMANLEYCNGSVQ